MWIFAAMKASLVVIYTMVVRNIFSESSSEGVSKYILEIYIYIYIYIYICIHNS